MQNVEDRIRERAHLIWEREGRPVGRELAHWELAAAELSAEDAGKPAPKARATRKPKATPAEGAEAPVKKPRATKAKKAAD